MWLIPIVVGILVLGSPIVWFLVIGSIVGFVAVCYIEDWKEKWQIKQENKRRHRRR